MYNLQRQKYQATEYAEVCEGLDLVGLICEPQITQEMIKVKSFEQAQGVRFVINMGSHASESVLSMDSLLADTSTSRDFGSREGSDLFVICTGGTTGSPRGVIWKQEDLFYAALGGGRLMGEPCKTAQEVIDTLKEGREYSQTILTGGLLVHGAGIFAFFRSSFTGGSVVLLDRPNFDPKVALQLCVDKAVQTILVIGDAMAIPMLDTFASGDYTLPNVGVITSSGAIISDSVKARLEKEMRVMVLNNLGASETGHQGAALYASDGSIHGFMLNEFLHIPLLQNSKCGLCHAVR